MDAGGVDIDDEIRGRSVIQRASNDGDDAGKSPEAQHLAEVLKRQGYCVIPGALDHEMVDRLERDVMANAGRARFYGDDADGKPVLGERFQQAVDLAAKSPALLEAMAMPVFHHINEAVMLDHCDNVLLAAALAMVVYREDGAKPQYLHRDEGNYPYFLPRIAGGPEYLVNVIIPCCDFSEDIGATRIVPQSHLWPREQWPQEDEPTIPLVMQRGDIGVWLGSTYHGAGVNLTDAPRAALIVSFCPGWLRPLENQFLQFGLEEIARLPRQVQQYLGYDRHKLLGTWDWRAPLECLDEIGEAARRRASPGREA